MTYIVDDIFGGIYKKYADTAALNALTATTTSMFFVMAGKGDDMPYIVVSFVSNIPDYILFDNKPREDVRVQFGVFDDSRSHATASSIAKQIDLAFGPEGSALTFEDATYSNTNLTTLRELVVGPEWDGAAWQITMDYMMRFNTLT